MQGAQLRTGRTDQDVIMVCSDKVPTQRGNKKKSASTLAMYRCQAEAQELLIWHSVCHALGIGQAADSNDHKLHSSLDTLWRTHPKHGGNW
jgi:hypothetical protein